MSERISVLLLLLLLPGPLRAEVFLYRAYTGGHVDIGPRIVDGRLTGFWKNDDATVDGVNVAGDFAAESIRALGVFDASTPAPLRPGGSQWNFLGVAAGEAVYILPSSGIPATLPYLGFSTEHTSVGHFDAFRIVLESVNGPENATFSLYTSSSNVTMNTQSGPPHGILVMETGDHLHFNWAFSRPGTYDLRFRFEALNGDVIQMTGTETFRFHITTGGGYESYAHWRRTHFRPEQIEDENISGPAADAGASTGTALGFTNAQRFAFGNHPSVQFAQTTVNGQLHPSVWLKLRKDTAGLETRPETAVTLSGSWSSADLVEVDTERHRFHHDPGLERRLYRLGAPAATGPRFFRAFAELDPE